MSSANASIPSPNDLACSDVDVDERSNSDAPSVISPGTKPVILPDLLLLGREKRIDKKAISFSFFQLFLH